MYTLIELYEALKKSAGEEQAKKAIESLENHILLIKEQQATKDDVKMLIEMMNKRFEAIDKRFEFVEERFKQIDKRFEQIEKRFEQIEKRFEMVDKKFERLTTLISAGFGFLTIVIVVLKFLF